MGLFQDAESTSAYAKVGVFGPQGSGKTFTSTEFAIGIVDLLKKKKLPGADKPVYFLDTETGSDWIIPRFKQAGIKLRSAKTRAFANLIAAVDEAEKNGSVLIIDSISHFWREFTEAYARAKGRKRGLELWDWGFLKPEWAKFTTAFINSKLHIIIAGRAQSIYNTYVDDSGKKQIEVVDQRMAAEKEMGYEPSLLVEMLLKRTEDARQIRVARILKDRSTLIDGKEFEQPTFADFAPFVQSLNLGGAQMGVDSATSDDAIPKDGYDGAKAQVAVLLDEIQGLMVNAYPGQDAASKKAKADLLQEFWNCYGWEAVTKKPIADLKSGLDGMHLKLKGTPYYAGPKKEIETDADGVPME